MFSEVLVLSTLLNADQRSRGCYCFGQVWLTWGHPTTKTKMWRQPLFDELCLSAKEFALAL